MSPFEPLANADLPVHAALKLQQPAVFRGLAAHWPAVRNWSFSALGALAPEMPVELVLGNRELQSTELRPSTLMAYMQALQANPNKDRPLGYLKEFDLLGTFPNLQADLLPEEIFPARTLRYCHAWIGPAHARTGLHYDFFANLAVQILGHKRFYLLRPGVVEQHAGVSPKYDQWATLASVDATQLQSQHGLVGDCWTVDLAPGDVLFVPPRWWHEVVNLSPGILLGGFFGYRSHMYAKWMQTRFLHGLHRMGLWRHGQCTCHAPKAQQNFI